MTKSRDLANAATALNAVTATEIGYVDGVTSAIQTQLNAKQAVVSGVNDTEIGYLDGVTSAIQTQLDAKTAKSTLTTTGDIYYASSANTPARLGIGSTDQILKVSGGVPVWATPAAGGFVGAIVYKSADQSISNGTWTLATWDSEVLDTNGYHDNSTNNDRLTIPSGKAGKYVITMNWVLNGGSSAVESYFGLNGAGSTLTYIGATGSGATKPFAVTREIYLNLSVGDWVNMSILQASGGAANLLGTIGHSYFSLEYLGA